MSWLDERAEHPLGAVHRQSVSVAVTGSRCVCRPLFVVVCGFGVLPALSRRALPRHCRQRQRFCGACFPRQVVAVSSPPKRKPKVGPAAVVGECGRRHWRHGQGLAKWVETPWHRFAVGCLRGACPFPFGCPDTEVPRAGGSPVAVGVPCEGGISCRSGGGQGESGCSCVWSRHLPAP